MKEDENASGESSPKQPIGNNLPRRTSGTSLASSSRQSAASTASARDSENSKSSKYMFEKVTSKLSLKRISSIGFQRQSTKNSIEFEEKKENAEQLGIRLNKQTSWGGAMPYSRQMEAELQQNSLKTEAGALLNRTSTGSMGQGSFWHAFEQLGLRDVEYEDRFKQIVGTSVWDDLYVSDGSPQGVVLSCVHSRFVLLMDCWRLSVATWTVIFAPLAFALRESISPSLFIWDGFLDFTYAITVMIRLQTSYISDTGIEVKHRPAVLRNLFRTPMYWIECVSCVVLLMALATNAWSVCLCLKTCRGLVLTSLPSSLWQVRQLSAYKVFELIAVIVLGSHVVACVWMSVNGYKEAYLTQPELFSFHFALPDVRNVNYVFHECPRSVSLYLMSYVEGVYMITGVGLDDPLALSSSNPRYKHAGGLLMLCILGAVGCLLSSFIFSSFVIALQQRNALDIKHREKVMFMREAMRALDIPPELQHRIVQYQHFQRLNHSATAIQALFDNRNLTDALSTELRVFLYHRVILNTPFFARANPHFNVEVILALEDEGYLPGDYVIRQGDIGHEMFFLLQGEVAILDNNDFLALLHTGDYFGEVALLHNQRRVSWVRANTYCVVGVLDRARLEMIFEHFPDQKQDLSVGIHTALVRRSIVAGGSQDSKSLDQDALPQMTSCKGLELLRAGKMSTILQVPTKAHEVSQAQNGSSISGSRGAGDLGSNEANNISKNKRVSAGDIGLSQKRASAGDLGLSWLKEKRDSVIKWGDLDSNGDTRSSTEKRDKHPNDRLKRVDSKDSLHEDSVKQASSSTQPTLHTSIENKCKQTVAPLVLPVSGEVSNADKPQKAPGEERLQTHASASSAGIPSPSSNEQAFKSPRSVDENDDRHPPTSLEMRKSPTSPLDEARPVATHSPAPPQAPAPLRREPAPPQAPAPVASVTNTVQAPRRVGSRGSWSGGSSYIFNPVTGPAPTLASVENGEGASNLSAAESAEIVEKMQSLQTDMNLRTNAEGVANAMLERSVKALGQDLKEVKDLLLYVLGEDNEAQSPRSPRFQAVKTSGISKNDEVPESPAPASGPACQPAEDTPPEAEDALTEPARKTPEANDMDSVTEEAEDALKGAVSPEDVLSPLTPLKDVLWEAEDVLRGDVSRENIAVADGAPLLPSEVPNSGLHSGTSEEV